jgi:hypothetical protein
MKKILVMILICCYFGVSESNAEESHVLLTGNSLGYILSSSSADPLTEAMANWNTNDSIAFPYGYSCLGVHRTGTEATLEVNRIVINLTKIITESTETGEEIVDNLKIYTSSDNVTYTLLDNTSYVTTLEILSGGNLKIMADGLGITQPYIKLSCPRTAPWYVFGLPNISLYTLNSALFGNNQSFIDATIGYYVEFSSSADPLTQAMSNFGAYENIAFPYGYSCIGIRKDDSEAAKEVGRIIISLDKVITSSPEFGEEIIGDLELYVSNDNVTYKRISDNYTRYMGRTFSGIKIVLDGLSIKKQYIKLGCPRTGPSYVYAKLLPQMVKIAYVPDKRQIFSLVGIDDFFAIKDPLTAPLTESLSSFGSTGSVAFPYRNICIGIRKDDSEDGLNINRIVLNLEKLVSWSTETGEEIIDDLNLHVSDDNLTYSLVPKTYSIYFDTTVTDGLRIVLDGLDISQKYVKVSCPRTATATKYVFGQTNLQSLMSVFHYTPSYVVATDLPRFTYSWTTVKVSVTAKKDEIIKLFYVPSSGPAQHIWTKTITSDGTTTHPVGIDLEPYPVGKIKLRFELFEENNTLIDQKDAYIFNTTGLVSSGLLADNVSVIVPQVSNLTGTWGDMSMTVDIDRTINYKQAQNSEATCTLNLPDAGWCVVYVGLVGGDSRAVVSGLGTSSSTVKLEYWRTDIPPATEAVGDTYVGCYDLSGGKTITITRSSETTPLRITHVAVHKLSQSQINIATQDSDVALRVIAHNDGNSDFFAGTFDSEASLQNDIGAFANIPIYSYDWCLGTTTVFNIATRYGASFGANGIDPSLYYCDGDRLAGTLVQGFLTAVPPVNPLSVICNQGDQQGTMTNVTLRMGAFYAPPWSYALNGPILNDSNDYRQRNTNGTYAWRLSYAYPEVRDYVIETLRDALASNVDGVHLQFLRHPPFFGYDQPIIDEYINRYGAFSPTDYMNTNWQQLQRDIMTDFISDIYQMVQGEAPIGKTIKLKVSFDHQNYYLQGLDVAAWIDSGWVDVISPGCYWTSAQNFDLSPFVTMVAGTPCKIFVHAESTIIGKDPTPEEENGEIEVIRVNMSLNQFKKYFMDMHAQGADGLYPFNGSAASVAYAIRDMKDNRIWSEFEEPFIDWFD